MPKGKNRQLTLEDRTFIEDRIKARDSLSEAARRLGVSASTVSREIKRNRVPESPGYQVAHENLCRKAAVHYGGEGNCEWLQTGGLLAHCTP